MRVGMYVRVSDDKLTTEGERRQDVERQIDLLKPYAKTWLKNHPKWNQDIEVYCDDALSAFKDDYNSRPAFVRLLNDVRANKLHRVFVENLDRWSRRIIDGLTTMQEASDNGLTVVSVLEGEIDVTYPQGWFRCSIGFLMAEWASRIKSHKISQAMERRRNDKRKICHSCGVVHLGRHPNTCECTKCKEKKGRV